jgi:hypothetical protein
VDKFVKIKGLETRAPIKKAYVTPHNARKKFIPPMRLNKIK